jgi:4-amino-4-deoxy-L-arabinose transferase-like glycosyltransferase
LSSFFAFAPLVLAVLLTGILRSGTRAGVLRDDLLVAVLATGVSIGLATETLSFFRGITESGVRAFWLLAVATAAVALAWRWRQVGRPAPLHLPKLDLVDRAMLGGIATLAIVLLVVAWLAPPQSSDALSYHMGRVMHWIQNGSVAPYPTYDSRQLYHPPLAEMVQLHLYLLSGSDRAGSLLQWVAMMFTLLAVSRVAQDLGGGRRAQIFAALVAITLPIGVTQATAGKNGWVEALWLLSFTCFSKAAAERFPVPSRASVVAAFAALGLGLMTKLTSWLFAGPIAVVAAVRLLRLRGVAWRTLAAPAALGFVVACALTFPFLARNVSIYGNPVVDPVARARSGLTYVTPATITSNAIRNAFMQLGTDSPAVNSALMSVVDAAHYWLGVSPQDPRTSNFAKFQVLPPTKIEEWANSPLHILLLVGVGVGLLASARLRAHGASLAYLAALGAGYVLFCATVAWQPPNCRLLLPLLVLASPLVAVVIAGVLAGRVVPLVSAVLVLAAFPYAIGTDSRPLSFEPGKGLLATPRSELYFTRFEGFRRPYTEVARVVRESRVRNLGVVFPRYDHPEYLLWVLLQESGQPVRVEHVLIPSASARLLEQPPFRDFRPDLVVVFARNVKHPFEEEVSAAGSMWRFVRRQGLAGLYEAAPDPDQASSVRPTQHAPAAGPN